jgi:ATP-dependent Clp protease ATP-binding subunit ClpA
MFCKVSEVFGFDVHVLLGSHHTQDFEKAGQLRDREMELKAQIAAIAGAAKEGEAAEAEATADGGGPLVTEQDIANIVAQWTGIPVEKARGLAAASPTCSPCR